MLSRKETNANWLEIGDKGSRAEELIRKSPGLLLFSVRRPYHTRYRHADGRKSLAAWGSDPVGEL
ncbi:hypothetical protein OIDMADRAFT_19703, partial [Oidiodendron maius Zn]